MKLSSKELFASNETLSLRKLALVTEVSYGVLLKASKKPIAGVPYDPTNVNYDEIDKVFAARKIELADLDPATLETEVRAKALKDADIRVGAQYTIRGNEQPWKVIAMTSKDVCIQQDDSLRAMSIATFMHQTPKLVTEKATAEAEAADQR